VLGCIKIAATINLIENSVMERKLASVVRITDIQPIVGADAIEVATVKGWKVVVKKNEFKVGDLAVYFEIDSLLPLTSQFEFLRSRCYKRMPDGREGLRLKTVKLRGQISQGLLTPLPNEFVTEGDDLTSVYGVIKYEPPIPAQLSGLVKGLFPSFIPKTDEERIQNYITDSIVDVRGLDAYITEKLDGSSFTAYIRNSEFGICSRNLELKHSDDNAYWQASAALDLQNKLASLQRNIALQGELVGPGVQGNLYGLSHRTVYFFTGYDIDAGRRLTFAELKDLLTELKLPMVPVLEYAYVLPSENVVETMLAYAEGKSALNPRADREGVVVRGVSEEFSFKAISNRYLLNDLE
jgi:hypothetical protein